MAKIQVGLIRCDCHGMYYGALMADHDPVAFNNDSIGRGHASYYYLYTYYDDATVMTAPQLKEFEIVKVWDENPKRAELMNQIWHDSPKICKNFEEVSDDVDLVFISDCNGEGYDHLELAQVGLKKGIPTFLDKPFAFDIKDAQEIVKLSEKYNAPVYSASMLSETPQVHYFKDRFQEIGQPEFGTIKGGGVLMSGQIHAINFALKVFGEGVKYVECMGQKNLAHIHLDYGDQACRPKEGVVINCASGVSPYCAMYASAYSEKGSIHSNPINDFAFPSGAYNILKKVKNMVDTGKLVDSYENMIEGVAIATAARLAQKERRRVAIHEVLK